MTFERILTFLQEVSPAHRGLMTDVDGTISPIAPSPGEARVLPLARNALARLHGRAALAVITGRGCADARRMVELPGLVYFGNHGLEECWPDQDSPRVQPTALPYVQPITAVLETLSDQLIGTGHEEGILLENKGATASIHYRLAPDQEVARFTLLELVEPLVARTGLKITEGRCVLEIRPPLEWNKGLALRRFIELSGVERAVFLGDDTTDLDAFLILRRLAAGQPGFKGLAIGVNSPAMARQLEQACDLVLPGVEEVGQLLYYLAEKLV